MKMASKAAEVSPPSQSASSHDQQTARHLLRSHRSELLDRLTPSTIKRLADKLYELEIISYDEMEDIRRNRRPTLKMARQLVTVIETRSWAQCLKFISLLQKTEGIEDLGTKLLHETDASDGKSLDYECLVRENFQLREKEEALTKTLKNLCNKSGQHQLMETATRCKLEKVEGVPYENREAVKWSVLPRLTCNESHTINRVAAVGNTIVAGHCLGSNLYTLDNDGAEWVTHEGSTSRGVISSVFSYQNACYVAASKDHKMSLYKWYADPNTWCPITDMPTQNVTTFGASIASSVVASDEHIYVLGGLHASPLSFFGFQSCIQPHNTASVLNLKSETWQPLPSMPFTREAESMFDVQALNTAVVYDMKSDKWQPLPNMPFTAWECSSALIDNTLYVAGGATRGTSHVFLSVSEVAVLPLNESKWKKLTPLKYGSATVTGLHDKLIATGGESLDDRTQAVCNVEVFDTTSNKWLPLPNMTAPRCFHGICITENNSLAVVGGQKTTECEILNFL